MKKAFFSLLILLLVFSLHGCGCSKQDVEVDAWDYEAYGVKESGKVIDITELNGQATTTAIGDVLYLKLIGEADSKKQWNVISPTSGDYIMLKDHKVKDLANPEAEGGQFTDEWWLKIENQGEFKIKFNYGILGEEIERSFSLEIIGQ